MKNILILLTILAFLVSPTLALAREGNSSHGGGSNRGNRSGKGEIKLENRNENEVKNEVKIKNEVRVRNDNNNNQDNRLELRKEIRVKLENILDDNNINKQEDFVTLPFVIINNNNFKIIGVIDSVDKATTSFRIGDHTIFTNMTKFDELEKRGILKVGNLVGIKGVIINGNKFTEQIINLENNQDTAQNARFLDINQSKTRTKIKAEGIFGDLNALMEQIRSLLLRSAGISK